MKTLHTYDLERDLIEELNEQLGLKTDDINFLDTDKIRRDDGFIVDPIPHMHLSFGHYFNKPIEDLEMQNNHPQVENQKLTSGPSKCKRCKKPFIKGRSVVSPNGIKCGHCGVFSKNGIIANSKF